MNIRAEIRQRKAEGMTLSQITETIRPAFPDKTEHQWGKNISGAEKMNSAPVQENFEKGRTGLSGPALLLPCLVLVDRACRVFKGRKDGLLCACEGQAPDVLDYLPCKAPAD